MRTKRLTEHEENTIEGGFPVDGFPLERLRSGTVEWRGPLPSDPGAWSSPELLLDGKPRLELRVTENAGGRIHVAGQLDASVRLTCRRCLKDLVRAVAVPLDLWLEPSLEPWEEEEGVYGYDPSVALLDLMRPLREELILALPEYPVCDEMCLGLCAGCGAALKEEPCACGSDEIDPRWAVLRTRMRKE